MQLVHSLTLTGLVVMGSASAFLNYREKPLRDVAVASALLATISAAKLADPEHADKFKAMAKMTWAYLSGYF